MKYLTIVFLVLNVVGATSLAAENQENLTDGLDQPLKSKPAKEVRSVKKKKIKDKTLVGIPSIQIQADNSIDLLGKADRVKWREAKEFIDNFQLPSYMVYRLRERVAAIAAGESVEQLSSDDMLEDAIALDSEGFVRIYLGLSPKNRVRFERLMKKTISLQAAEI